MGLKLGSLFDGIATFPLSGSEYGFTPVWASEIEPFPIRVSRAHFPHMKHLGDIKLINGAEIEPVDVITFGSPCQELSTAGQREGLSGERSGLFMQAVRIIREMRTATGGEYPRFAVWENVPGAFSSHKGEDFRAVLEEIAEAEIPMPNSGKWATAGMVRTATADIAWRVLDSQYHGVPQRRKRIFLVADFGGQCAGEILFVEEGLRGDTAESRKAREEAAANIGNGIKGTGGPAGDEHYNDVVMPLAEPSKDTFPTLGATTQGDQFPHVAMAVRTANTNANGHGIAEEKAHTLDGAQGQAICIQGSMIGRTDKNGPQGDGVNEEVSFTLNTIDRHAVAYPDSANTLLAKANMSFRGDTDTVVAIDCRNLCENEELSATLQAKNTGGQSLNYTNPVRIGYKVRRLTPLECERLQGLPDGWTDIPPQTEVTAQDLAFWRIVWDKWDDINGKKHHSDNQIKSWLRSEVADTVRYRAIGNGIAKPCSDFVMGGIARVMRRRFK